MHLSRKVQSAIADRFENALDFVAILDKVPYCIKREAAEAAAKIACTYITDHAA